MLTQERLVAYLEGTLDQTERADVERLLTNDAVAQRQLAEQQQIDQALRVLLGNAVSHKRVKQSILAVVRGESVEQLKARVIESTAVATAGASESPTVGAWTKVRRLAGLSIQRFNDLTARRYFAYSAAAAVVIVAVSTYFFVRPAPTARVAIGQFATVMGTPKVQHAGKFSTLNSQRSTPIYFGDRIETGDIDKAEIQFNDGTTLRLNFNTTIEVPSFEFRFSSSQTVARPREIKLLLGQIWSKVQKTTNAPQFAIHTPVATAAVKGTEFGLKLRKSTKPQLGTRNPELATNLVAVLTVKEGAVEFSNAFGKVEATALTETQASADTAPTAPTRIASLKTFRLNTIDLDVTNPQLSFQDSSDCLVYPIGWIGASLASTEQVTPAALPQQSQTSSVVRISRVVPGSPAEQAGLQADDLISAMNGQIVSSRWQARAAILAGQNQPITLSIQRAGEEKIILVTPGQPPDAPPLPEVPANVQAALYMATRQLIVASSQPPLAPGQATEGEMTIQQLLRSHPDCAAVHHNLAFLHETKDEMGEAIRHYHRAVELDPQAALYHFNLGLALRSVGNVDRFVEELEEAERLAPAWSPTARWLADAYTLVERYADAVKAVDAGLQRNPQSAGLWRQKAEVLLRSRQPEAALAAGLKAIELAPSQAIAHIVLGNVYEDLGRIDDAEAAFRKAIELGPMDISAYLNLGKLLREHRGQFDEAEKLYRKAIELEPDDAGALDGLGTVFAVRRQIAEAEKWFRKAVESDANSPVACNNLGEALRNLGQLDEAEKHIRKAIALDPGFALAHANLGMLHMQRQQWDEAEQVLLKAGQLDLRLSLEEPLAMLYQGQGKLDQVELIQRRALERNANSPNACNNLAWHLAERGIKLDEALTLARRAVELAAGQPDVPGFLDTLGWVQFQRGELAEAEATLKKALELAGENPPAADIREHLKKVAEKKRTQPK